MSNSFKGQIVLACCFIYISNKRSFVGILVVHSQFGCSVLGQRDHGAHDSASSERKRAK